MKGIDASAQYHVDLMLKKHIRACVHILMASRKTRVFTLAGSVKTGRGGLALSSNSPRIFMRLCASTALRRRLFEVSSWSPRWTTLVATYVIRSSSTWNSLKASCSGKKRIAIIKIVEFKKKTCTVVLINKSYSCFPPKIVQHFFFIN